MTSRTWLVVEAWREDREINKLILADAIKALVVIVCAVVVGYAGHLLPGATAERLALFESYHFYSVLSLCGYFMAWLVVEMTMIFVRRIKRLGSNDV